MWIVVCYDITDDRRRTKLAQFLSRYLDRVQKSVFEGEVTAYQYEKIRMGILELVNLEEDSIRIYHLCRGCRRVVEVMGIAPWLPDRGEDLVF